MKDLDHETFRDPPSEYRPAPFWALNDDLTPDRLKEEIAAMDEAGIGGFFLHSRPGLKTPYLKEEWFEALEACLEEAEDRDMLPWLYDEDRWPSGTAGGRLTKEEEEFRARHLFVYLGEEAEGKKEGVPLGTFACERGPGGDLGKSFRELGSEEEGQEVLQSEKEILVDFYWDYMSPSSWFNDQSYLDILNPEAVDGFLDSTYREYAERFGDDFGRLIPGIFTDEPHFAPLDRRGGATLPWTKDLEVVFRKKKGYSLLENLPCLVLRVGNWPAVRHDYWRVLTDRFLSSFCQPVYDWCEENDLLFTGHYWEHGFPSPASQGTPMAPLAYMGWPGIDLLGKNVDKGKSSGLKVQEQTGHIQMVKSASSVARQFGRERVLSETYGGGGWDLSFKDQKEMAAWQGVLGVDYVCLHLSLYSLRGGRKRDFPPSFGPEQPWWKHYRKMADYVSRLSYGLSAGVYETDLLVLHPATSTWLGEEPLQGVGPGEHRENHEVAKRLDSLLKDLERLNWDYDLGDEVLLARFGETDGPRLQMGEVDYGVVLLPPLLNLEEETLRLLLDFMDGGGLVAVCGSLPQFVDGRRGEEEKEDLEKLSAHENMANLKPDSPSELDQFLATNLTRRVKVIPDCDWKGSASISYQGGMDKLNDRLNPVYSAVRRLEGTKERYSVFLFNTAEESRAVQVSLPARGDWAEWDLLSGDKKLVGRATEEIGLHFAPGETRLLVMEGADDWANKIQGKEDGTRAEIVKLDGQWEFERTSPNVALFDFCQYRLEGEDWSQTSPLPQIWVELMEELGLEDVRERRGNRAVQPWSKGSFEKSEETVQLRYYFKSELDSAPSVQLVVEDGGEYEIEVNGREVGPSLSTDLGEGVSGIWKDPLFARFDLGELIQQGENEIVLSHELREDWSLENIYLIGDFAVKLASAEPRIGLTEEPSLLEGGSWVDAGYPFYAGSMKYRKRINLERKGGRVYLELPALNECASLVATVRLNGEEAGHSLWPPYRVELTSLLEEGENELEVELTNSARNLMGPHHDPRFEEELIVPPTSYIDWGNWSEDYLLAPDGLPRETRLKIVRE